MAFRDAQYMTHARQKLVNSTMSYILPHTLNLTLRFTFLIFPLLCTMEIRKYMQVQGVIRKIL